MPYITPQTTPSTTVRRCLFIPDEIYWLAAVNGALTELTKEYNWEDVNGITAAEAVEAAQAMLDIFFSGECTNMIGELVPFALQGALPDDFLLMDGSQYDIDDYATLASLIPEQWVDVGNGTFVLPNMAQRTVIGEEGSTGYDIGDVGGEVRHTLTTSEMPTHRHSLTDQNYVGWKFVSTGGTHAIAGGTTFVSASILNSGGGESHQNMPPFLVIKWGIRWR